MIACLSVAVLGLSAGAARAGVVDVTTDTLHSGFQVEGDSTVWLDLSYTTGLTYPQVQVWADSFDFQLATRVQIETLFDALLADGYVMIPERKVMGGYVVSGYNSVRGFFDDGTANATVGKADCTLDTGVITDDALSTTYYDSRFGAFVVQTPEPSTLGLLAAGGLALLRRRRT